MPSGEQVFVLHAFTHPSHVQLTANDVSNTYFSGNRDGESQVLVCSDMAARGLDVPSTSLVIQVSEKIRVVCGIWLQVCEL